ncbi:MAG: hypothetical protein R2742_00620 [Micropruina glycogenica]
MIGQDDVDLLLAVMDAPRNSSAVGIIGDRVSARIGELHGCSPQDRSAAAPRSSAQPTP